MVSVPRLADLLRGHPGPSDDDLDACDAECARTGEPLAVVLHRRRVIDDEIVAGLLVKHLGLPYLDAAQYGVDIRYHHERPELARQGLCVLDRIGRAMVVAMCDVVDTKLLAGLETTCDSQVYLAVSTAESVETALNSGVLKTRESKSLGLRLERARLWGVASDSSAVPVDLARVRPSREALRVIEPEVAKYYRVLPVSVIGALTVAVENPYDTLRLDDVSVLLNRRLRVLVAQDVARHIEAAYANLAG